MDAIEELKKEHEAVRLTLEILERISEKIEQTGKIPSPAHLAQLLEFFRTFVDRCHHGKEEELLFPALEAAGVSNRGGPIGVLRKEHQLGRDRVGAMARALAQYQAGRTEAAAMVAHHARAYILLLKRHIDKENQVLFVLASRCLPPEKLAACKAGFDRIETRRIGAGRHEAYHRLLEQLAGVYLKAA